MLTAILIASVAVIALFLGAALGISHGIGFERRRMWRQMTTDRKFGHEVLEELGRAHGAKVELTEL